MMMMMPRRMKTKSLMNPYHNRRAGLAWWRAGPKILEEQLKPFFFVSCWVVNLGKGGERSKALLGIKGGFYDYFVALPSL